MNDRITFLDGDDARRFLAPEIRSALQHHLRGVTEDIERAARQARLNRPALVGNADTAAYLGVSADEVGRLRRVGKLGLVVYRSKKPVFRRDNLDAYLLGEPLPVPAQTS